MKAEKYSSMGVEIEINVPETVEEFDKLAKKDGSCLASANDNTVYRSKSCLPAFRKAFAAAVEKESGVARKQEPSKTRKEKVQKEDPNDPTKKIEVEQPVMEYTETEQKYFARVCTELDVEPDYFQNIANDIAKNLVFDPSEVEREAPQPKKTPQVYLDAAKAVIDQGKGAALAAKLTEELGTAVEATQEGLGKAIALREARKRAEEKKKVAQEYANMVV